MLEILENSYDESEDIKIPILKFLLNLSMNKETYEDFLLIASDYLTKVFNWCSFVLEISLPRNIKHVPKDAFLGCKNLTSVTIPDSVTSIGDGAFSRCTSLTSIEIPSSVTSTGEWAFAYCSSLTSIEIPSSVTYIDFQAFTGCNKLSNINFNGTKAEWRHIEKRNDWKWHSAIHTIKCNDGEVNLK